MTFSRVFWTAIALIAAAVYFCVPRITHTTDANKTFADVARQLDAE